MGVFVSVLALLKSAPLFGQRLHRLLRLEFVNDASRFGKMQKFVGGCRSRHMAEDLPFVVERHFLSR